MVEHEIIERSEPGYVRIPFFEGLSILHAFSTRKGGVSGPPYHTLNLGLSVGDDPAAVQINRRRFFGALGLDLSQVVRVRQVHGNDVLVVDQTLAGREKFPRLLLDGDYSYDAMVTNIPGLGLTIGTADCHPIFIVDRHRGALGAVHAGWRSSVKHIVGQTLKQMRDVYGTNASDCFAGVGPGIRGCCYEVDEPVITQLKRAVKGWQGCVEPAGEGRWMLDLATLNIMLLHEVGLKRDHIFDTGFCTACRTDLFYSYRAEKPTTGRMMSLVALI